MSEAAYGFLNDIIAANKAKTAPKLDDDIFFEHFCVEQILKPRDLTITERESGYTRDEKGQGTRDGGIDAAYFFCNGKLVTEDLKVEEFARQDINLHLVIIQATRSPSFEESVLTKFRDTCNDLIDRTKDVDAKPQEYNHEIRAFFKMFRQWYKDLIDQTQIPTLRVTFYYASKNKTGKPHPVVEDKANQLKDRIEQLYSCECNVDFVNASRLLDMARQKRRAPLPLTVALQLPTTNAFICLVTIPNFIAFITTPDGDRRDHILDPNVRGFLGPRGVNKEILQTLTEIIPKTNNGKEEAVTPKEFWWLNNGVTILASKVEPGTPQLILHEPRIVNGLQTSRMIYEYSDDPKNAASKDVRHLMVRIIQTSDQETVNAILRATNRQTNIGQIHFHGTEDIHHDIQGAFPKYGLLYERVKNQYADDAVDKDSIITLPYLMQALIAVVRRKPDQARARPTQFAEKDYKSLFRPTYVPEIYANAAWLAKRVERFLRDRTPVVEKRDQNNLKFYVALYAACALAKTSEPSPKKIAGLDIHKVTDGLLEEWFISVNAEYLRMVRDKPQGQVEDNDADKIAKGSEFSANVVKELEAKFPPHRRQRKTPSKARAAALPPLS
jgi:hypothetical protein